MNEKRTSIGSRLISMLLVAVMVIGMVPLSALTVFAAPPTAESDTKNSVARVREYAQKLLNENFSKTSSAPTWDTENKKDTWRYYNGAMVDALTLFGVDSGSGNVLEYAYDYYEANITDDGTISNYHAGELDSVPPALGLFYMLDSVEVSDTDKASYKKAINYVYGQLENQDSYSACGGNYLHKMNNDSWATWNIGLDGIYMAQPFLVRYANALAEGKIENTVNGDTAETIYQEVVNRLVWVAQNMQTDDGLYHHGWNVSGSRGNGICWSRGAGWYATGLVLCMEELPASYRQQLIDSGALTRLFDRMIDFQDAGTGMWYNIVDKTEPVSDTNSNRLETSGSALMAYAMMKAYNEGWVTDAKYGQAGLKAFNGIVVNKLDDANTTLSDIYRSSGVATEESGYCTAPYVENEAKGVCGLLMAASVAEETAAKLAGTAYAGPTASVGVLNVTELSSVNGVVDTSGLKATVVDTQGNLTVVDGADLNVSSAGAVSYNGVRIAEVTIKSIPANEPATATGTVNVEVTVPVASGYKLVTSMTPGKNYLIVAGTGTKAATYDTSKTPAMANAEVAGIDANDVIGTTYSDVSVSTKATTKSYHWQIDAEGHVFATVDGTNYYLKYTGNSNSNREYTQTASDASVFTFNPYPDSVNYRYMDTTYENETVHTKIDSGGFRPTTSSSNCVRLYEEVTGGTTSTTESKEVVLSVVPDAVTLDVNGARTLTPTVTIDGTAVSGCTFTYGSDTPGVATVSNGTITGVAAGTANITVTLTAVPETSGTLAGNVTVTIPVTVNSGGTEPEATATGFTIDEGNQTVQIGQTKGANISTITLSDGSTLDATAAAAAGYTVSLASSGSGIVSVSGNTFTAQAVGTATITATLLKDGVSVAGVEPKNFTVTVEAAAGQVYIDVDTDVRYVLNTKSVVSDEVYVIAALHNGQYYVLRAPESTSANVAAATVTATLAGNELTFAAESGPYALFTFTGTGTAGQFQIYNGANYDSENPKYYYIRNDNTRILTEDVSSMYVIEKSLSDGQFRISSAASGGRDIQFDGTDWGRTGSSDEEYVLYLFKRTASTQSVPVTLTVSADKTTIYDGVSATVTPAVTLNGVALTRGQCQIDWSCNDSSVTFTENADGTLTVTGANAATAVITGTVTSVTYNGVQYPVTGLQDSVTITVKEDHPTYTLSPQTIYSPLGEFIDFSAVKLTIASESQGTTVIPVDQLDIRAADAMSADGKPMDIDTPGSYLVDVYYNGVLRGTVTVHIGSDPYQYRDTATDFPEYPDDAAVRMDKFATGINFAKTGVAQVEVNAAGITTKGSIDVIIVTDVSNSMAWTIENSGNTGDANKIPSDCTTPDYYKETKLYDAMEASKSFASILLGSNTGDKATDNTLTFVTFGGNDGDRAGFSSAYIDSVRIPFVAQTDLTAIHAAFDATRFYLDDFANKDYRLTIGGIAGNGADGGVSSGANRGNTLYDYGFVEAQDAANLIKDYHGGPEAYAATGREIHVIFMTDGAPSTYNDTRFDNSNGSTVSGTITNIGNVDGYSNDAASWLRWIQRPNLYATALRRMDQVSAIHAVGFDLANGGYGGNAWTESELGRVLEGLVQNEKLQNTLASDTQELNEFFEGLGHSLAYAGTHAVITDTIGDDYRLHTASTADLNGDGAPDAPTVNLVSRRLVLQKDVDAGEVLLLEGESKARAVTPADLGKRVQGDEILATITFNADGTITYTAIDNNNNISTDPDGSFRSAYITYDAASKTFTVNVGDITEREYALQYYVYLNETVDAYDEGTGRADGLYDTNEVATLKYVDINGDVAVREYPVPKMPWGSASVTVRFVLVNKEGQYVNRAGVGFTNPEFRIFLPDRYTYETNYSGDVVQLVVTAQDALQKAGLTGLYTLYDSGAGYTIPVGSEEAVVKTHTPDKANMPALLIDVDRSSNHTNMILDIPVLMSEDLGQSEYPLDSATVVADYGKPMVIDIYSETELEYFVTGNYVDHLPDGTDPDTLYRFEMELAGFGTYNDNFDLKKYVSADSITRTPLTTANGSYELFKGEDGYNLVKFTPGGIMHGMDKVFVAVQFRAYADRDGDGNYEESTDYYYYMYKVLNVIPATVVYYETDGNTRGSFAWTGSWSTQGTVGAGNQDSYTPGSETYGYDSSYNNDLTWSNGSTRSVTGEGFDATYTTFTFTGTGFDIISSTGANEGLIRVTVTDSAGNVEKSFMLFNKGKLELYQLPVISVHDLAHDTYTVKIAVHQGGGNDTYPAMAFGNHFNFDAVRIYGTMAGSETFKEVDGMNRSVVSKTVTDQYEADKEASPTFTEVRDILIKDGSFAAAEGINGAVFMDDYDGKRTVTNYDTYGANNEVYLEYNQAVAFSIDMTAATSVDIGLKSINNLAAQAMITVIYNGQTYESETITLNNATAQFFDVPAQTGFSGTGAITVIVQNVGASSGGILSITDVKLAYGAGASSASLFTNSQTIDDANGYLNPDCAVESAQFATEEVRLMRSAAMQVVTTTTVTELRITDENGNPVWFETVYQDTANNQRIWTVTLKPTRVDSITYKVTGYAADGTCGEAFAVDTIVVNY